MKKNEYLKGRKNKERVVIKRGDVIYVDLSGSQGSEQGKVRPCLVIQNDIGNKFSPTLIIVPIGHKKNRTKLLPTQVGITSSDIECGKVDGIILCEQPRTVDRVRVGETNIAKISESGMEKVKMALLASMSI